MRFCNMVSVLFFLNEALEDNVIQCSEYYELVSYLERNSNIRGNLNVSGQTATEEDFILARSLEPVDKDDWFDTHLEDDHLEDIHLEDDNLKDDNLKDDNLKDDYPEYYDYRFYDYEELFEV